MLTIQEIAKEIGKTVLFLGVDYQSASQQQIIACAENARRLGFDSILVKAHDGGIKTMYNGPDYTSFTHGLAGLKNAVNHQTGMGCFFYGYCYGPRFGYQQMVQEAELQACLAEAEGHGVAVADMEVEYNDQGAAAADFARLVTSHNVPGWGVSTWADPLQQNWQPVLTALEPYAAWFSPQQYTNWLLSQEWQLHQIAEKILPTGSVWYDAIQSAAQARARGHAVWLLWEYDGAVRNPSLTRAAIHAFKG